MFERKMILKKQLCFILCLCMAFSLGSYSGPVVHAQESVKKMIHYKHMDNNRGIFGQDVNFEKDVTYTFSYSYSMIKGEHNTDTGMFAKVLDKALNGSIGSVNTGYLYSSEKKAGDTKGFTTMVADGDSKIGKATYTFTWTKESGVGSVFFHVPANKGAEFYLADVTLYKSKDNEKTNLLKSIDETGNLNGWLHTNAWPAKNSATWTCNDGADRYKVSVEDYDGAVFGETTVSQKMLYVDVTKDGVSKVFGQNVKLTKGSTYTISFQYKFEDGSMNTEACFRVKDKFGSGSYKTYYCSSETGEKAFTVQQDNELAKVSYTFTHTGATKEYGIGFEFLKSVKLYLADLKMYDVSDKTKANLFPAAKNESSLEGWRSDWRVAPADTADFDFLEGGKKLYNAKVMDYDANVFKESGEPDIPIPDPPAELHKMLHYQYLKNNGGIFGQNVTFEKDQEYTISFEYKMIAGEYNTDMLLKISETKFDDPTSVTGKVRYMSSEVAGGVKGFSNKEEKGDAETGKVTYTFKWEQESGDGSVWFHTPGGTTKEIDFYLANVVLYRSDDAEKTNLLASVDTNGTLKGWGHPWQKAADNDTEWTAKVFNQQVYTVTVLDYDKSLFELSEWVEPQKPTGKQMIYVEATTAGKDQFFGQNLKLEKGKTYTIAYQYKFLEGEIDESVFLRVKAELGSGVYKTYYGSGETGEKGFSVKTDKKTCKAFYTFTHRQETGVYGVGFQFTAPTKLYLADVTMYDTNDADQTNLLPACKDEHSLEGWRGDWTAAGRGTEFVLKDKQGEAMYTATLRDYDAAMFQPDPELPPKMVYIENNGTYRQLVQRVKLEVGETYRFSFCVASPVALKGMVMHQGARVIIFNNMAPINDPDYTQDYYEAVYEFTLPETHGGEQVDLGNLFVGIQFPAGTIGYVFQPKLWNVKDPEKTNIYKNPGFNKGLDNWAFSWGAWFTAGQQGLGLNEYESDGNFKLQVMDYDASKFITYYDDSRIDDGEWWSADDVKVSEKKTSALVKGRYMYKDKTPVTDAELMLESLKESFTCKTDEEGRFEFADIPEGYYKLYVVQETEGQTERIETGFAASIKDGYKVNIDVYSDGTVVNVTEPWVFALIGGGAAVLVAVVTAGSICIVRRRKKKLLQAEQKK